MKRVLVDYKKLTPEVLSLLVEKYPHGYDDGHVLSFTNHKDELIEAVEVRTQNTVYLVKVSRSLQHRMSGFSIEDYEVDDFQTPITELPDPATND